MHPHLVCSHEDNLVNGSANLRIHRGCGGSTEADLTCGCLHTRGLALVPALLCCEEDGVFLPRLQVSQHIGGGVPGKRHLHWLA